MYGFLNTVLILKIDPIKQTTQNMTNLIGQNNQH